MSGVPFKPPHTAIVAIGDNQAQQTHSPPNRCRRHSCPDLSWCFDTKHGANDRSSTLGLAAAATSNLYRVAGSTRTASHCPTQADSQSQSIADVTEIVTELQDVIAIAPKQAKYIQDAIRQIAQRVTTRKSATAGQQAVENQYQLLFGQFKTAFRIPRYDALPRRRYNDALTWLQDRAASLLPDDQDALPPHQERLL